LLLLLRGGLAVDDRGVVGGGIGHGSLDRGGILGDFASSGDSGFSSSLVSGGF